VPFAAEEVPMPSILITGAGRGLGLEFAKQYTGLGYRVFATAREPGKSAELSKLAKAHTSLSLHPLDVTDEAGLRSLVSDLQGEPIDILLNNAGTMGPAEQSLGRIDYAGMVQTFVSNTVAPLRIAEALIANVAKSQRKLMVAVTSGMGSISDTSGGFYAYRASKAALNMSYHNLALDLRARGVTAIVINPGWVKTDMGGPGANLKPADSIAAMRKVFDTVTLADSGKFMNYSGGTLEW
jgi:NAD(P)-dependent dehydrogenase (short-subunit alcohol dehydrogenase family)